MFLLILLRHRRHRGDRVNLHSTMFLLIPGGQGHHSAGQNDLHSTMFLLILFSLEKTPHENLFTFHNVSINSGGKG